MTKSTIKGEREKRPYRLRATKSFRESEAAVRLRECHQEYHRRVGMLVDLWCTVQAGIPASAATTRSQRVRVAMSYFNAESKRDPFARSFGPRIVTRNPLIALQDELREQGLAPDEVEVWVSDCKLTLQAPIKEDAEWINRRAMYLRDRPGGILDKQALLFCNFISPGFLDERDVEDAEAANKYNMVGRNLISKAFGEGKKSNILLKIDALELFLKVVREIPEEAEVFGPDILEMMVATGVLTHEEILANNSGAPNKHIRFLKEKVTGQTLPFKDRREGLLADAEKTLSRWLVETHELDLSWLTSLKGALFGEIGSKSNAVNPMVVESLVVAFSHHTKVSMQETERSKLRDQIYELDRALKAHPKAVSLLDEYVATRQAEHAKFRLRPRAATGLESLCKEFASLDTEEQRLKTLARAKRGKEKPGDHRLAQALVVNEARPCWEAGVVRQYVERADMLERVREKMVPMLAHPHPNERQNGGSPAPMRFGPNNWRCHVQETPGGGEHQLHLYLWDDKNQILTLPCRSSRVDQELLWGFPEPGTARGKIDRTGARLFPGQRPSVSEEVDLKTGLEKLSACSFAIHYVNGIPYIDFVARIIPRHAFDKDTPSRILSFDVGLQRPASWSIHSMLTDEEGWALIHENNLVLQEETNLEGNRIVFRAVGEDRDGRRIFLCRVPAPLPKKEGAKTSKKPSKKTAKKSPQKTPDRWLRFVRSGVVQAQGDDGGRKISREEFDLVLRTVKRTGSRRRVESRVPNAQTLLIKELQGLVRTHGHLISVAHNLLSENKQAKGIEGWRSLCWGGHPRRDGSMPSNHGDGFVRGIARQTWERVFGRLPDPKDELPPGILPARRDEVVRTFISTWKQHEEELSRMIDQAEAWVAPVRGSEEARRARRAGGLSDHRLNNLLNLRRLIAAWEGRATLANPKGINVWEEKPDRLHRLEEFLQRKKRMQWRQVVARLFQIAQGEDDEPPCTTIAQEKLDMERSQTKTRASNRQAARLAPSLRAEAIEIQAKFEGMKTRGANPYLTSLHDNTTGRPCLRVGLVSVERLIRERSMFLRFCEGAAGTNESCGKLMRQYVERLLSQWDEETSTWTDSQGRKWVLTCRVPVVRWRGPGREPPAVHVPQQKGALFAALRDNKLCLGNADINAANNIALAAYTTQWRVCFPAGERKHAVLKMCEEVLAALALRDVHGSWKVATVSSCVKKPKKATRQTQKGKAPNSHDSSAQEQTR